MLGGMRCSIGGDLPLACFNDCLRRIMFPLFLCFSLFLTLFLSWGRHGTREASGPLLQSVLGRRIAKGPLRWHGDWKAGAGL